MGKSWMVGLGALVTVSWTLANGAGGLPAALEMPRVSARTGAASSSAKAKQLPEGTRFRTFPGRRGATSAGYHVREEHLFLRDELGNVAYIHGGVPHAYVSDDPLPGGGHRYRYDGGFTLDQDRNGVITLQQPAVKAGLGLSLAVPSGDRLRKRSRNRKDFWSSVENTVGLTTREGEPPSLAGQPLSDLGPGLEPTTRWTRYQGQDYRIAKGVPVSPSEAGTYYLVDGQGRIDYMIRDRGQTHSGARRFQLVAYPPT